MPLSMSPHSRREFILGSVTTLAGIVTLSQNAFGSANSDPDFIALLSDTHIAADPATVNLKTNMADNLIAVREQLLRLPLMPGSTILTGDCAYLTGEAADYITLAELTDPLSKAGHSLHYLLGNHDNLARFRNGIKSAQTSEPLESKHVTRIETRKANLILLDSLDKTNSTPGVLGVQQLKWIETALDMDKNNPTIVMVHHNPVLSGDASGALTDTRDLFDLLAPRRQVKMVIFGHTHHWEAKTYEGIHLINLPPVAYPFNDSDPCGWVAMHLAKTGMSLTLHALKGHKVDGQKLTLPWRN